MKVKQLTNSYTIMYTLQPFFCLFLIFVQFTFFLLLDKFRSFFLSAFNVCSKAELYVATQKETAAIIGKLLRMGFHHKLLSIEVVRKDTGGKEDGDESKKECKGMSSLSWKFTCVRLNEHFLCVCLVDFFCSFM